LDTLGNYRTLNRRAPSRNYGDWQRRTGGQTDRQTL